MPRTIQLRRGIATEWSSYNPILAEGEMGIETDTLKLKIGNGTDYWNDLDYYISVDNVLTSDEKAALAGTDGTPSSSNKYVTNSDSRMTDDRDPNAHASSHLSTGSDAISNATTEVNGLMSTTDKSKLDGIEASATADMTGSEIVSAINSSESLIDDDNIVTTIARTSEIIPISYLETEITDSDVKVPSSGAVVDYVASLS